VTGVDVPERSSTATLAIMMLSRESDIAAGTPDLFKRLLPIYSDKIRSCPNTKSPNRLSLIYCLGIDLTLATTIPQAVEFKNDIFLCDNEKLVKMVSSYFLILLEPSVDHARSRKARKAKPAQHSQLEANLDDGRLSTGKESGRQF
jgi:hypothetical protein